MKAEIEKLQQMIDESKKIVFFGRNRVRLLEFRLFCGKF